MMLNIDRVVNYQPMLAVDVQRPPRGGHFDFEVKFDGFRCGAMIEGGRLKLLSRNGANMLPWFPELADLPADVAATEALLDGEIIVGAGSVESFNALLKRARLRGRSTPNTLPVSFVAFDVVWFDGADWTQRLLV
jgi:bifunctional non-homologous end joining protein LigD